MLIAEYLNAYRLVKLLVIIPYPSILHLFRQHDNGSALSLVDHLPEVSAGLLQRSLGYDERLLLAVVAGERGVDVVRPLILQ